MAHAARLSIGEMAELNQVSVQTLRYYDSIGLLKPEFIDAQTGYRYYNIKQSARLDMIQYMKCLGLSLATIASEFENDDLSVVRRALREQELALAERIGELRRMKRSLKSCLEDYSRYAMAPKDGQIGLERIPARRIYRYDGGIDIYQDNLAAYEGILRGMKRRMASRSLPLDSFKNVGSILRKAELDAGRFVSTELFVFIDDGFEARGAADARDGVDYIPESDYLCIYCDGFDKEKEYARRLFDRIGALGYEIVGDYVCEVIAELPARTKDERSMFIRLQVPIKKLDSIVTIDPTLPEASIKGVAMNGYKGRILTIDLGSRKVEESLVPESWYGDFIGGEGFAAKILYDRLEPGIDPLGERNLLAFATGPLTGTKAPASGRLCVGFKSPLSGTIGLSNVGGHIAPMLKRAGYDVVVIAGKSAAPVYVYVHDGLVEFKDARHVWGLDTEAAETAIRGELKNDKVRIAQAGPAGEKLIRFSSIMVDAHRAVGRGGAGAVMGSKNLKALVCYGDSSLDVSDAAGMDEHSAQARRELEAEAFVRDELKPFGTPSFTDSIHALGLYPTKNWEMTTFDAMDTLGHKNYHESLKVKKWACAGCPIACGRHTEILSGPYRGESGGGPEYESIGALGAKCYVKDLNAITEANYLCNRYGLDTISTGQIIATAMEWYEKGYIDKTVTDGVDLSFGNGDAVIAMVRKIGEREGFGDTLAEGSLRAARALGGKAADAVMTVKGLEMAACGVQASKGEALSFLISARGGDHLRPYASAIDAFGYLEPELGINDKVSPFDDANKAWVKPLMELSMLTNMLGVCLFTVITLAVKGSTWTKLYNAATGKAFSFKELLRSAERVLNLERLFNAREGFDRKDDVLPARLTTVPAPDGLGKGQVVDTGVMLDEFYAAMGWDLVTGLPTESKKKELGLV